MARWPASVSATPIFHGSPVVRTWVSNSASNAAARSVALHPCQTDEVDEHEAGHHRVPRRVTCLQTLLQPCPRAPYIALVLGHPPQNKERTGPRRRLHGCWPEGQAGVAPPRGLGEIPLPIGEPAGPQQRLCLSPGGRTAVR